MYSPGESATFTAVVKNVDDASLKAGINIFYVEEGQFILNNAPSGSEFYFPAPGTYQVFATLKDVYGVVHAETVTTITVR